VTAVTKLFAPVSAPPHRPTDGILNGTIESATPGPVAFDRASASASELRGLNLSVLEVSADAWPVIFTRLLGADDATDYENLTQQWRLTTLDQWNRHAAMRRFVGGMDNWLLHSEVANKQLFFNVAMALAAERFFTIELSDTLLVICEHMAELFGGAGEAAVFAHVRAFVGRLKGIPSAKDESRAIHDLLREASPSTEAMLDDRNLKSLEFCRSHCDTFFSKGRPRDEGRLFMAAAVTHDPKRFRIEIVAAALILAQERLQRIPITEPGQFYASFASELATLPVRLLVWNSDKLRQAHSPPVKR
jgi:hypothetical protein